MACGYELTTIAPTASDLRRVTDLSVLGILRYIFSTNTEGHFTCSIRKVRNGREYDGGVVFSSTLLYWLLIDIRASVFCHTLPALEPLSLSIPYLTCIRACFLPHLTSPALDSFMITVSQFSETNFHCDW